MFSYSQLVTVDFKFLFVIDNKTLNYSLKILTRLFSQISDIFNKKLRLVDIIHSNLALGAKKSESTWTLRAI